MNIREIAVKVLDEVLNNKAFSNIVLDKALGDEKITQVDKNFITMLVHGVLQNYYLLDYKIKKLNPNIQNSIVTTNTIIRYRISF